MGVQPFHNVRISIASPFAQQHGRTSSLALHLIRPNYSQNATIPLSSWSSVSPPDRPENDKDLGPAVMTRLQPEALGWSEKAQNRLVHVIWAGLLCAVLAFFLTAIRHKLADIFALIAGGAGLFLLTPWTLGQVNFLFHLCAPCGKGKPVVTLVLAGILCVLTGLASWAWSVRAGDSSWAVIFGYVFPIQTVMISVGASVLTFAQPLGVDFLSGTTHAKWSLIGLSMLFRFYRLICRVFGLHRNAHMQPERPRSGA